MTPASQQWGGGLTLSIVINLIEIRYRMYAIPMTSVTRSMIASVYKCSQSLERVMLRVCTPCVAKKTLTLSHQLPVMAFHPTPFRPKNEGWPSSLMLGYAAFLECAVSRN